MREKSVVELRCDAGRELTAAMNALSGASRLLHTAAVSSRDMEWAGRVRDLWAKVNALYVEVAP